MSSSRLYHAWTTICAILLVNHLDSLAAEEDPSFLQSLLNFLVEGGLAWDGLPEDAENFLPEYDFIIVGAGSAGCLLANRLTENKDWSVLLVEAGRNANWVMDIPLLAPMLQVTDANWHYLTEPQPSACLGLRNKRCHWPRGKVLGGSSVLNFMVYTRGNKRDYDNWEALGNKGWGYRDVLPHFKKFENMSIPELQGSRYHSTGGRMTVSYPSWHTPLSEAFLEAGVEKGFDIVDYNGGTQTGFSFIQSTTRNGRRWSSATAFLDPIRSRRNLHVAKETLVTKVLVDPSTMRTFGVRMTRRGKTHDIRAKREVILSAGAINSPQLLLLSGIGPREHLESLKIPVLQDLKVGHNLMDHMALGGLTFLVNSSVSIMSDRIIDRLEYVSMYERFRKGPLAVAGGVEALAFLNTKYANETEDFPDVELLFIGASINTIPMTKNTFGISDEIFKKVYEPILDKDAWMVFPMVMRPKSRGIVQLKDRNPRHAPLIFHNYFSDERDLDTIVEGTKMTLALSKTKAFQKFGTRLHDIPIPGCDHLKFGSDKYWRCATRHLTFTIYHQSGTCKMGPRDDPSAVVDPNLRVYGVKGLRVVDASIMPDIPTGHINAPIYMIAEKAADIIKKAWEPHTKRRL